jgi:hypothetical protein
MQILDRKVLASFLPNHQAIKAFEDLFIAVSQALPATQTDLELGTADAQQKAGEALAGLAAVAEGLSLVLLAPAKETGEADKYTPIEVKEKPEDVFIPTIETVREQVYSALQEFFKEDLFIAPIVDIVGNAGTANKLRKSVTINGIAFDGSGNITINAVDSTARAKLAGDSAQDFAAKILTLAGLLDLSAAAAGQIKFPATQNPSADANTLDDYEEGSFTPTITGDATAGVTTYAFQLGRYTKVGRLVSFVLDVNWTNLTGTGNLLIGGLPFTSANTGTITPVACRFNNISYTAGNALTAQVGSSATTIYPIQMANGAGAALIPVDTSGSIQLSGTYIV